VHTIHAGNILDILPTLPDSSHHGCLTDPPYELGFMGKKWDSTGVSFNTQLWEQVLRILTPGAYLMAFGGTRTFHRMACAIEDAGFEIRDCLSWLYATGFPKSKACLKPAWEPVILARKPSRDKFLPLNIEECRIGNDGGCRHHCEGQEIQHRPVVNCYGAGLNMVRSSQVEGLGRYPTNVILDESFGEGWKRYFYCAKASHSQRHAGCENLPLRARPTMGSGIGAQPDQEKTNNRNTHPTVKPLALTSHLAKLILPLPQPSDTQRRLLVPFSGSGSEMIGGLQAGWDDVTGVELQPEYREIAEARIAHWITQ
jgi:DNA modification methylase